jgi:hypothetical protein
MRLIAASAFFGLALVLLLFFLGGMAWCLSQAAPLPGENA